MNLAEKDRNGPGKSIGWAAIWLTFGMVKKREFYLKKPTSNCDRYGGGGIVFDSSAGMDIDIRRSPDFVYLGS